MKQLKYIVIALFGVVLFSCSEDDAPQIEDHFLSKDIPIEPVNDDYAVGAFYKSFTFNNAVVEVPTAGKYVSNTGDKDAYEKHVKQAATGGIDYFIFGFRSANLAADNANDIKFINTLQTAPNALEQKFALNYSFSTMALSDARRIETAPSKVPVFLNDFMLMLPYFKAPNYMKIDGKCVVYISSAHNLYSNNNAELYKQLRTQMSAQGIELFIIGNQQEWTPPLRYDFRFVNGVDAVTHSTYNNIDVAQYDRNYFFAKYCNEAWGYSKTRLLDFKLEYVATISPSYNKRIITPSDKNYVFPKNVAYFESICNVARRASGTHKLVLVDSFNDWNIDTQVESAVSYGDTYLSILKKEFKKK
nr:glycoside hydrolase family 99-like domain-containing protein [uncultured Flavobacterium sp.]